MDVRARTMVARWREATDGVESKALCSGTGVLPERLEHDAIYSLLE